MDNRRKTEKNKRQKAEGCERDKKKWERDFWLNVVDEVNEAERRGDSQTLYKKLRDIDFRDQKHRRNVHSVRIQKPLQNCLGVQVGKNDRGVDGHSK